jgi:hypothetical protein
MTEPNNDITGQPSFIAAPSRALPQIRLTPVDRKLLVSPCTEEAADQFEPFLLPAIPLTISNHCSIMAETFYQKHHRCIGFVLLSNCPHRAWGIGVPQQRCSPDSACWDALREDFADLPAHSVVAGSFQSRIIHSAEELPEVPPPHDGIHLVQRIEPNWRSISSFVRIGSQCTPISFDQIFVDDWSHLIDKNEARLKIV